MCTVVRHTAYSDALLIVVVVIRALKPEVAHACMTKEILVKGIHYYGRDRISAVESKWYRQSRGGREGG